MKRDGPNGVCNRSVTLIIQNKVSHTIMRAIFQRGGGPIERSYFDSDFVCWLCTEVEYIDFTVLGIST
jgi:hypothetical protein